MTAALAAPPIAAALIPAAVSINRLLIGNTSSYLLSLPDLDSDLKVDEIACEIPLRLGLCRLSQETEPETSDGRSEPISWSAVEKPHEKESFEF